MVSFSKDVTVPIKIPEVTAPDFSRSQSTSQDVLGLFTFGLQLNEREQLKKAEVRREGLVGEAQKISESAFSNIAQGMSTSKALIKARQSISSLGIVGMEQQQLSQFVGKSLGFTSLGSGLVSEQQKREQDLDVELRGLSDFLPLVQDADRSLDSYSNDEKEVLIGKAQSERNKALAAKTERDASADALRQGKLSGAIGLLSADKSNFDRVGRTLGGIFQNQLTALQNTGQFAELAPFIQQAKESLVGVLNNFKTNLTNEMSGEAILRIQDKDDRKIAIDSLKLRQDFYNDQIKFYNELEDDKFKDFADLANLLQSEADVNLQQAVPELLSMQKAIGSQAMNTVINRALITNPSFRNALSKTTLNSVGKIVFSPTDTFSTNMGIVAGIGKGKALTDYTSEDQNKVADLYWRTTKEYIDNPEGMTEGGIVGASRIAVAAMQVLEFAEERGTAEDKERATKTLNSPQFKALYDNAKPALQNAMGRKILQYNRDTFSDKAKNLFITNDSEVSEVSYNATAGKFEIKQGSRTGASPEEVVGIGRELRAQKVKVDELNKQLAVIDIYAKDDPVLSQMTSKERKDFFITSSRLSPNFIKGALSRFEPKQIEAQERGVSVKELEATADIAKSTRDVAQLLEDVEVALSSADIGPEAQKSARAKLTKFLGGQKEVDTSDLDDEEFEEFIKQQRAARASR